MCDEGKVQCRSAMAFVAAPEDELDPLSSVREEVKHIVTCPPCQVREKNKEHGAFVDLWLQLTGATPKEGDSVVELSSNQSNRPLKPPPAPQRSSSSSRPTKSVRDLVLWLERPRQKHWER